MIPIALLLDSFGRSSSLEFHRSICLERGNQPAVGGELATTTIANTVFGFGKFIDRDWFWYPTYRNRINFGAEFSEVRSDVNVGGAVTLNSTGFQTTPSKSAGWDALFGDSTISSAITTSRTNTEIVVAVTFRSAAGTLRATTQRVTVEGTPVDVRLLAGNFWTACGLVDPTAIDRPPLRTFAPVLFEVVQAVNDDLTIREISRGLRPFPPPQTFIDALIAQSQMQPTILGFVGTPVPPDGFVDPALATTRTLAMGWVRHVRHYTDRGEIQRGDIKDPFIGPTVAVLCERGFTEEYEYVIPPLLNAGDLADFPIGTINGSLLLSIERRVIAPNPVSSLLTC